METVNFDKIIGRIKLLIKSDSRNQQELFNYLGKSRQVYYQWQHGDYPPTVTDLFLIAKYFGVPLEYLIAGEENPIDDATAAFIVQTRDLTEEQKKVIYASIKAQFDMFKRLNEEKEIDN